MQKLQLTIPEPCHENWQNMTPTEQGRFCNACAKEVVDFSMMTDTEVLNYFTAITHEKVCGRALPSQLERTITKRKDPKKKLFWYWNYIVMFFMFFGKGNSAKAQRCGQATTEAQLNIIRSTNVNNALAGKVAGPTVNKIITGKVTGTDGKPVSYASIKVKGANTGVSADVNGIYSLKVNSNAILIISAAGFVEREVPTGNQSAFNTVLEKGGINIKEVVVTAVFGNMRPVKEGYNATFVVKDIETGSPISKAKLVIVESGNSNSDIAFTDNEGNYKAKRINVRHNYNVKVMAEGYQNNEFTIEGIDFKNGKKEWEILLRKRISFFAKKTRTASQNIKGDLQVHVIGQTYIAPLNTDSLYVIDGDITTKAKADNLSPDDISDIVRLEKSEAAALFGIDGSNGAIVITTRKAKEIKLKEVVVNSEFGIKAMAGGISFTNTYENSFLGDAAATVKTLLTDSIKVYPNPVNRNSDFSVALKLKQPGNNYSLLITDATGEILLQQKFNAHSKDHTEKITGDRRWAAGMYYIRIFDTQNKLISKSSFIFQ